jgi:hypothetical protein
MTAFELFKRIGDSIQVVTNGAPGVPHEFACAWRKAGGTNILCVLSDEYEKDYAFDFPYMFVAATQKQQRIAMARLYDLKCALVIQGGMHTTEELCLLSGAVPVVSFWGSGGAAGGQQPYEGWAFTEKPAVPILCSEDPAEDPRRIAEALTEEIQRNLNKK